MSEQHPVRDAAPRDRPGGAPTIGAGDGAAAPAPDLAGVMVIIPALNEEASLPRVLADLPAVGRVIVVDNGSTDGTARLAAEGGALVVAERRRGYGAACLRGLAALADLVTEGVPPPRVVAFLDTDYSDHPDRLPTLVAPILEGTADFVLGSRLLGAREPGAMTPQSLFGNRLACFLMRHLFGGRYTDLGPFTLAGWFAWRSGKANDSMDWLRFAFLTTAWFWLLLPTLNPWYWTWAVPLLPFVRNRAWLALSGLVFLYYLRFWLTYHYADAPVIGTRYPGAWFFDYVVTWLEFGPWFAWLGAEALRLRARSAACGPALPCPARAAMFALEDRTGDGHAIRRALR